LKPTKLTMKLIASTLLLGFLASAVVAQEYEYYDEYYDEYEEYEGLSAIARGKKKKQKQAELAELAAAAAADGLPPPTQAPKKKKKKKKTTAAPTTTTTTTTEAPDMADIASIFADDEGSGGFANMFQGMDMSQFASYDYLAGDDNSAAEPQPAAEIPTTVIVTTTTQPDVNKLLNAATEDDFLASLDLDEGSGSGPNTLETAIPVESEPTLFEEEGSGGFQGMFQGMDMSHFS